MKDFYRNLVVVMCSILMISANIYATNGIKADSYTIEYADAEHGMISGPETAAAGDTITVLATPDDGYRLATLKYTDTDDHEIRLDTTKFIMPAHNVTVTATFAKTYNITYTENEHGIISGDTVAIEGDTITVTAEPNEGYQLASLHYKYTVAEGETEDETEQIPIVDSMFIMPAHDVTVTATFAKTFKITYTEYEHGIISGDTVAIEGDTITVTATPNDGYRLTALKYTDTVDHEIQLNSPMFIMPAYDVTVAATFAKIIAPQIIMQPESTAICYGDSTTLHVKATHESEQVVYQWFKDDEAITENGDSTALIVTEQGRYWCKVSESGHDDNFVVSQTAIITVHALPDINLPDNVDRCIGSNYEIKPGDFKTYLWNDNSTNPTLIVSEAEQYSVTVTNDFNCKASDSITITYVDTLIIDFDEEMFLCEGSDLTLTAPEADNYIWSNYTTNRSLTIIEPGTYGLTITQGACFGKSEVTVSAADMPAPFSLGRDTKRCAGEGAEVVLVAPQYDDVALQWSNGETNDTLKVTTSGTYSLTVTNEQGCSRVDDITITFGNVITPYLGEDIDTCEGNNVVLKADFGDSFIWSTSNSNRESITVSETGTYKVTVTDGECTGEDSIHVNFLPAPQLNLGGQVSVCEGTIVTFEAPEAARYTWSTGSSNRSITATRAGDYACTVVGANGCKATDNVTLTFYDLPDVNLGSIHVIDENETTTLTVPATNARYLWSTGETTRSISLAGDTLPKGDNAFNVIVTDNHNCTDTGYVVVIVRPCGGSGIETEITNNIKIFPNPTSDLLNIEIDEPADIELFDIAGRRTLVTKEHVIDLSNLAKGTYTVKISTNTQTYLSKVVLM